MDSFASFLASERRRRATSRGLRGTLLRGDVEVTPGGLQTLLQHDISDSYEADTESAAHLSPVSRRLQLSEMMAGVQEDQAIEDQRGEEVRLDDEAAAAAAAAASQLDEELDPIDKLSKMFASFIANQNQEKRIRELELRLSKQYREAKLQQMEKERKRKEEYDKSIASVNRNNLPFYHEGMDVLSFLSLYEKVCQDLKIPQKWYIPLIRTQCSGLLAEIVATVPNEDVEWEIFREYIKRKFGYTPEILRQNFRKLKKQPNECYSAMADRLEKLGDQWLDSVGASTFQDMRTLMYQEHFLSLVPAEIRSVLMQKRFKDLQELALRTDELLSFKRPDPTVRPKTAPVFPRKQSLFQTRESFEQDPRRRTEDTRKSIAPGQTRPPLKCFECGGSHLRRDCPKLNIPVKQEKEPGRRTSAPVQPKGRPSAPKMAYTSIESIGTVQDHIHSTTSSVPFQSSIRHSHSQEGGRATRTSTQANGAQAKVNYGVPRVLNLRMDSVTSDYIGETADGQKYSILDPDTIIPDYQRNWTIRKFTETVFLHTPSGDVALCAFRDSGAELSSISRQFLDPALVLYNLRCPIRTYASEGDELKHIPVAYLKITYKSWTGVKHILTHEGKPDFLLGNDLAVLDEIQSQGPPVIQVVTRSQSKKMREVEPIEELDLEPEEEEPDQSYEPDEEQDSEYEQEQVFPDDIPEEEPTPDDIQGEESTPQQLFETESDDSTTIEAGIEEIVPKGSEVFRQKQLNDPSLASLRTRANEYAQQPVQQSAYFLWGENGLLYREYYPKDFMAAQPVRQLVVPSDYRLRILEMAHDHPSSGHQGMRKTLKRISQHFYWPGLSKAVKEYVGSCDVCQRVGHQTDQTKAEVQVMEIPDQVFKYLQMDVLGPFIPTKTKKKYIITFICSASRWIEAYAISNLSATTIARIIVDLCSRIGVPSKIICDQAGAFTSELMKKICEISGITLSFSTSHHPQSHGMVERGQQTLLRMIKTMTQEYGNIWDELLPFALFAYRSSAHSSLGGFSPSELVFGRNLQGPLDILKSEWEGAVKSSSAPVAEFVRQLQEKLLAVQELARNNLMNAQAEQKYYHDKKSRHREFAVGDLVLVLNPLRPSKLEVVWEGPGEIVQRFGDVNYLVKMLDSKKKPVLYHVNRLKLYKDRSAMVFQYHAEYFHSSNEQIDMLSELQDAGDWSDNIILTGNQDQKDQLYQVLERHQDVFSDKPGYTNLVSHEITTDSDAQPIRSSPYRAIGNHAKQIEQEIQKMLSLGVIEEAISPTWTSPVVLVPKKTATGEIQEEVRFCVDYRKLNSVTKSDPYPLPRMDDLIEHLAKAKFISILDLKNAYWQLDMAEESRDKTAFITHVGTFRFRRMPFGLKNAGASFQRMIDKLLQGLPYANAYLDDVAIFSNDFESHLTHIETVLSRLQQAGLTVKASKCQWMQGKVMYLGHLIGQGEIQTIQAKVQAINDWPIPKTKKQVRSFLGLIGYYRKFIPDFSNLAAPLTELTRKREPVKVKWTPECQKAFDALKAKIVDAPILKSPDFNKPFVLQTDASELGLGAVLLQQGEDGNLYPISYFSRKLLEREKHYAIPEKEALSVFWALNLLRPYLWGRKFTLQTDHRALVWLQSMKSHNQKLLRWSLALQDFDFNIQHIPGKLNIVADSLSRMYEEENSCNTER
ncbi:uncharacterized protein LOC144588278 [Pogona vitticeps]